MASCAPISCFRENSVFQATKQNMSFLHLKSESSRLVFTLNSFFSLRSSNLVNLEDSFDQRSTMESPDTKKAPNLEDSGCIVDGLRSALCDGDVEDENSMMVRLFVNPTPFYSSILMSNFWFYCLCVRARGVHVYEQVFQNSLKQAVNSQLSIWSQIFNLAV